MNLKEIQEQLHSLLTGVERKIVFWYDEDAAYVEEIQEICLPEGSKLWMLTEDNWFETKLTLEIRDRTTSYVIYAPFARPGDKENHLADMFYYSEHFYSDRLTQLIAELQIPGSCQEVVRRYRKFWTSGNIRKFQSLQIESYTEETVILGMLCVVAGIKSLNMEELLRKVIVSEKDGAGSTSVLHKFNYYKLDVDFWNLCEKNYGYQDHDPSPLRFLNALIVTYMDTLTEGSIPGDWKKFVNNKPNDSVVFLKNFMNNRETKAFYDDFADRFVRKLDAKKGISSMPLESILACDALEVFDQELICWMTSKLEDLMLDEKIEGKTIPEICEERVRTSYHFAPQYRQQYFILFNAYSVIKEILACQCQSSAEEMLEDYVRQAYKIDTYYRKFYYYMDQVGLLEHFEHIRELTENLYTNKYLADLNSRWNQSLTEEGYTCYSGSRQEAFFDTYVEPFMHEDGRDGRVIVIISDGLRYECALELSQRLEFDEKCDANISSMLGVLPSETTLGMASLLPHKEILVKEELEIWVDGVHCGNKTLERQKILQARIPRSACYDFDQIMGANRSEIRAMLQDKEVVYIYHNQIDGRGETQRLENEVFQACQEAIEEIQKLIHRITSYVSATRYLVTADHGFLYQRDKLQEADKITLENKQVSYRNKRYLLSGQPFQHKAFTSRTLQYLGKSNSIYVTTPMGADIIKMSGGGQNYVHGGSSLQEMVIPVLKVRTFTGKQDTGMVNVELSSLTRRITGIEVRLDFMQMEAVSDTKKPRKLVAFFVDQNGEKISYDVPMIASVRSEDARERVMMERFTLKSGKYSKDKEYFLVLADMEDERNEYRRYVFEIDVV